MDTNSKPEHVAVSPYDDSMWDHNSMYDKMPYIWDPDLNIEKKFAKITGNIIKSSRCQIKEPYEVKHQ
jgi:hypothetical protein